MAWTPIERSEAGSIIGETIHTGLRKGPGAPEAPDTWLAISNSGDAWSDAIDFMLYCLDQYDMALCRKEA